MLAVYTNKAASLLARENAGTALREAPVTNSEDIKAVAGVLADRHEDSYVRRQAAEALQHSGTAGRLAVHALISVIDDAKGPVDQLRLRIESAKALASLGQAAKPATPFLSAVISDPAEPMVLRCEAAYAIGAIGAPAIESLPALSKVVKTPSADRELRRVALRALGQMGISALPAATAIRDVIVAGPREDFLFEEAVAACDSLTRGITAATLSKLPSPGFFPDRAVRATLQQIRHELQLYVENPTGIVRAPLLDQLDSAIAALSGRIGAYFISRYWIRLAIVVVYGVLFWPVGVVWRIFIWRNTALFCDLARVFTRGTSIWYIPVELAGWLLGILWFYHQLGNSSGQTKRLKKQVSPLTFPEKTRT